MLTPIALLLIAASPFAEPGQSSPTTTVASQSADEIALRKLNSEWLNAYPTRDTAAFDRILADDFRVVVAGGRVLTKADILRSVADPARIVTNMTWSGLQIFVSGDVAVVTGLSKLTGSLNGQDISATTEYADIYAKRDDRWRAIAAHVIRVPPPIPASTSTPR